MIYCKNCSNAIFDPVFGEYKCSITQTVVYEISLISCDNYEKGIPETSKETPDGYGDDE